MGHEVPPLNGWRRREDGVVVGVFTRCDVTFLRDELTSLRELVCRRLESMPVVWPFGVDVGDPVSAALPEDPRLRAVLADFYRDQPDWHVLWWEIGYWRWLEDCLQITLSEVLVCADGWLEVPDPAQEDAVVQAVSAAAAVAEHEIHGLATWLRRCARTLVTVDLP